MAAPAYYLVNQNPSVSRIAVNRALSQSSNPRVYSAARAAPQNQNSEKNCQKCPKSVLSQDPLQAARILLQSLDFDKLSSIDLSTQLLRTYATPNDFTFDISAVFSSRNLGVPFGAFPMYFPKQVGNTMIEALVSDFTFNSLLYSMHMQRFFTFRIGPETPKIGPLLKTTCSDDDDSEELEDHGVELDEEGSTSLPTNSSQKAYRLRRQADQSDEDEEGGLAELGICFGDIMPVIREEHPNKEVFIIIHSSRAPSIVLSAENEGTAKIDLKADVEIHIADSGQKVGTISVDMALDVSLHLEDDRIKGNADIKTLKLIDTGKTLGLPQDALDNLANLGKEMLAKTANDTFSKGVKLNIPTSNLPLDLKNLHFQIVNHAVYVASNFSVSQRVLRQFGIKRVCNRIRG